MASYATMLRIGADVSALERGVASVDTKLGSMEAMASRAGQVLAGAFAVTTIISAGKQVLDFAGQLTDLSQRTGMSTTALQKLEIAFAQSGVGIDKVVTASEKLSKAVVGGDKAAVGALEKLGLSVNQLKQMAPEEQFLTVADAIGKIQSPSEKTYAAMTLMGRGGAELLQGMTGSLRETVAEAERLGLVIGEDTIKAADDFGDQLGLLGRQLLGILANALGPLLPALSLLGEALSWLGAKVIGPIVNIAIKGLVTGLGVLWASIATLLAKLADLAQSVPLVGKHLGGLATASDWLKKSADKTMTSIEDMWKTTDKAGTSAATATPKMLGLGQAQEETTKATEAARKAAEKTTAAIERQVAANYQLGRSMVSGMQNVAGFTIRTGELVAVSRDYSNTLMEAQIKTDAFGHAMPNAVQHVAELETGVIDVTEKVRDVKDVLADFPALLQQAFTGGGGFLGALKAVSVELGDVLLKRLSEVQQKIVGVGSAAAAALGSKVGGGMGATVAGVASGLGGAALAASAWGKGMVGAGIAGSVALGAATMGIGLAAVGVVKLVSHWRAHKKMVEENTKSLTDFQQSIWATLTPAQALEANGETWKATVIGVRDAYLATGRTADEALVDTQAMWDATTQSTEATAAAMDRVNQAFIEQRQQQEATARLLEASQQALDGLTGKMQGVLTLSPAMEAALQAAFNAQTPEAYLAAVTDLNGLLDSAAKNHDDVAKAAERYGITIDGMGKAWQQQELNKKALELERDYTLLSESGANHTAVLKGMQTSAQDYLDQSRKFGTEIPESMKPMLQAMIEAGLLTDANGRKVQTLEGLGVTFGQTLEQSMGKVASSLEDLVRILTERLAPGIQEVGRKGDVAARVIQDGFDDARRSVEDLNDEIDATSYGHSPGGLKDIIAMAPRAGQAMTVFAKNASADLGKVVSIITTIGKGLSGLKPPPGFKGDAKDSYIDLARQLEILKAPTELAKDKLRLRFEKEDELAALKANKSIPAAQLEVLMKMVKEKYDLLLAQLIAESASREAAHGNTTQGGGASAAAPAALWTGLASGGVLNGHEFAFSRNSGGAAAPITIHVHGSVVTERELAEIVTKHQSGSLGLRARLRAA